MNKSPRSKDFRYIYANGIGLQFNGAELMLMFGVKEDFSNKDNIMLEEVGVIMAASSAKLLGLMIAGAVEASEKASGQAIPVDETKLRSLQDMLAASSKDASEVSPTHS